jgi:hypothetical protein
MGAAVYLLGKAMSDSPITSLIVTISSGVMLYAVALLLLGEIQSDEKRALQELFARHLPGRFTPASWKKMP